MMYTSLTSRRPPCTQWYPPNITAMWWLMAVNENHAHGGGLGPLVGGEVHSPAEGEAVQTVFTIIPR